MKTITKTMLTFATLAELYEATKSGQLTGQQVINGRAYINNQWQDFELDSEARKHVFLMISTILGGRLKTREQVFDSLMWGRPQHWGLSRIFFREYEKNIICSYCAGQDYTNEIKQIRNSIK
jgi:hypothetical protein